MYFGRTGSLVVGANGQDGILISEILDKEGDLILKIDRKGLWNKENLISKINDLEPKFLSLILTEFNVSAVYFFAAHSRSTKDQLEVSPEIERIEHQKVESLLKLVTEAIALQVRQVSLVFASSMRIFEGYGEILANEQTEPFSSSLYSDHKIRCMQFLEKTDKEIENMTSIIPILFNHESIYRKKNYLSSRIIQSSLAHNYGLAQAVKTNILNLHSVRDFGYAPQFMDVLIQLVRKNLSGTFILCTGQVMSVLEFIEFTCVEIGVKASEVFEIEESCGVSTQSVITRGDNSKVLGQLGYESKHFLSHRDLVAKLVDDWRKVLNLE